MGMGPNTLEWRVHDWLNGILEIPDAKLPLLSPRSEPIRCKLTELQSTNRSGVLLQTRDHGVLRFPLGADQAQRVPHGDGAVAEATGEESKRKGVALDGARARPGEAVEAVRGGRGGEEREVRGVGLEVEAEDLDVGGGGEAQVDGAGHGARGEVRRVRRQRRQRRPLRALDARHRRRDRADLGARARYSSPRAGALYGGIARAIEIEEEREERWW